MIARETSAKKSFRATHLTIKSSRLYERGKAPFRQTQEDEKIDFSLATSRIGVNPGRMSPLFPILSRCVVACHFVDSVEREKHAGVQKASVEIGFRRSANKSIFKSEKKGKKSFQKCTLTPGAMLLSVD